MGREALFLWSLAFIISREPRANYVCLVLYSLKTFSNLLTERFLRASQTKEKLAGYKDDFLLAKEELKTYFEVCHMKLSSTVSDKVDRATDKLDEILSHLTQANVQGESPEFWAYVQANGGENAVINVRGVHIPLVLNKR